MNLSTSSRSGAAGAAQDRAAGGVDMRKLRNKAGELVTVSVALTLSTGGYRATLRFKMGGMTVQRPIGKFDVESESQALRAAWQALRAPGFVEKEAWTWEVPNT